MSINNVALYFALEGALDAARVLGPRARSRDAFVHLDLSFLLARVFLSRVSCCAFVYKLLSVYFKISFKHIYRPAFVYSCQMLV